MFALMRLYVFEKKNSQRENCSLFPVNLRNRKISELKSIRYEMLTSDFVISTANLTVVRIFTGSLFMCDNIAKQNIHVQLTNLFLSFKESRNVKNCPSQTASRRKRASYSQTEEWSRGDYMNKLRPFKGPRPTKGKLTSVTRVLLISEALMEQKLLRLTN